MKPISRTFWVALFAIVLVFVPVAATHGRAADLGPFEHCKDGDALNCVNCCLAQGRAARVTCLDDGFSQLYCNGLAERVADACMASACSLKRSVGGLFVTAVEEAVRSLAQRHPEALSVAPLELGEDR